jgi:hypothetical protein
VLDSNGGGTYTSVCNGVDHVAANASTSDIINISIQSLNPISEIDQCVSDAADLGLRIVVAAGNHFESADESSPGRVEHPNVWTVSAYDTNDDWASFSNYGNPPIEYGGPGVDIPSLRVGGGSGMGFISGQTGDEDGTSYAAPHIAGLLLTAPNSIGVDGYVNGDPDSNDDPIAVYEEQILTVDVFGPIFLNSDQMGTWTASVSNNEGSVTYKWYRQNVNSNTWVESFDTDNTYSTSFYNPESQSENAGVKVVVTSAGESDSVTRVVTISSGPECGTYSTTSSGSVSTNRVPPPCN